MKKPLQNRPVSLFYGSTEMCRKGGDLDIVLVS